MTSAQLVITHDPEELSVDDAIITHMDHEDGYRFVIQEIVLKAFKFKEFIADIEAVFGTLTEYDYSKNKNSLFKKYKNDNVRAYVRGNAREMFGTIYSKTEEASNKIWNMFKDHYEDEENDTQIFMHSFFVTNNQLESNIKQVRNEDFNYISKKYYPYIDTDVMFDQLFTGNENILVIAGLPGLGKTKLGTLAIKHSYMNPDKLPYDKLADNPALENQFITIVSVKSTDVLVLDNFWRSLEVLQADLVIIDDLDYMLTNRDAEVMSHDDVKKNAFLNQFLTFTDGVEKYKTKFIITTNQRFDEIDAALLRKGRLFDILELRKLDKAEALAVWYDNNLSEADFNTTFKTHEILQAELGSEINKRKNNRIETAQLSYLKEDGISKIEKATKQKRIGL